MEKLKNINFKMVIFLLLAAVSPFISPSIMAPVCIVSLAGLMALDKHYLEKTRPNLDEEVRKELAGIKNQMSGLMIKNSAKAEPTEFKRFF